MGKGRTGRELRVSDLGVLSGSRTRPVRQGLDVGASGDLDRSGTGWEREVSNSSALTRGTSGEVSLLFDRVWEEIGADNQNDEGHGSLGGREDQMGSNNPPSPHLWGPQ